MKELSRLEERLQRLLSERMALSVDAVDVDLFQAGYLDSLTFADLLHHLERDFGVVVGIDDLEIDRFRSIARIAEFVAARGAGGAASGEGARWLT